MKSKVLLLLLLSMITGFSFAQAKDDQTSSQLRTLVNLLDYIGKDYPNAIKDGAVINTDEYREMSEFSTQIGTLFYQVNQHLNNDGLNELEGVVKKLQQAVAKKESQSKVARLAEDIRQQLLALNLIAIAPSSWPDLTHGKEVFIKYCTSCHGTKGFGDGPLAEDLHPVPANFRDSSLISKLSPFQAFNTIRLGIEGTAMRPFQELSEKDVWAVAFYINSLNYHTHVPGSQRKHIRNIVADTATISNLAVTTNEAWQHYLSSHHLNEAYGMSVLRAMDIHNHIEQKEDLLAHAIKLLNSAVAAYEANDQDLANTLALNAYLNGVEPRENEIRASAPALVTTIENQMIDARAAIKSGVSPKQLKDKVHQASLSIRKAQDLLSNQDYSFWFTFLMSASILLREGLEAVLIIMVILGVLQKLGADKAVWYVHGGWIVALLLGAVSWFFTETLIQMSSFQREMMEGIGSIIAVGMLLYIGFWLHNKTHASQWTKFVKEKIHRLVVKNNRWGLAVLAFIVVFREAFESVIFLSSVSIKSTGAGDSGIVLGSLSALVAVLIMAFVFIKFSKRLPIRSLFKYSSFVMAILAVVLVGKGIHEFQEAGYLGIHTLPIHIDMPLLGLYPTFQTIVAQIVIISSIAGLWYYSNRMALLRD